ncbi:MAG TPA: DUF5698 domain-containing protein [bacterium]|nr:DUF5698 domain-containing protein [bacterium]
MFLFFIGIIEMLIVTSWTKLVSETKVLASGFMTVVNIVIWYYVLRIVVDDIGNWKLVLLYAIGCALGTMLGTYIFRSRDLKIDSQEPGNV